MERLEYFKNYLEFLRDSKTMLSNCLDNFEVYVFGSVVEGDYSVGLSDIDVAIVSNEFKSREKKLGIYDLLLEKYFYSPFEFHLLTEDRWNFYRRFVKSCIKV